MIVKPNFLLVENEPGLVRDTSSNAIIATSLEEKRAFIERQKRELNISRIGDLNSRIEKLENNMEDIKSMLQTLINNGKS
jgi:porphobilinogen deaminase